MYPPVLSRYGDSLGAGGYTQFHENIVKMALDSIDGKK